jgi:hypothetical protein
VAGAAETAVAVDVDNKAVIRQGSVRHNSTISVISQSRAPVKMQVASWPAEVMDDSYFARSCLQAAFQIPPVVCVSSRFRIPWHRHGKCPFWFMKQFIIYSMVIGGLLASRELAHAEHDKACKNVHGKVTVVTENGVTVNDKLYKVGKSTRLTKGAEIVKLEKISAGDGVCLDTRGTDDVAAGGEVAAVTVMTAKDSLPATEKEVVREKVVREKELIREEK